MGWSGGTYTKGNAGSGGWVGDASLGIAIEASRHDTQDNDFATGINNCLTKDGQNTPTANLGMGGYKHTGVGNATAGDEYLSYGQLLDVSKAVTTGGTAPNYTVTLTPAPTAYVDGMSFCIQIHSTLNVSGATLNVNGLGAKNLKITKVGTTLRDPIFGELSSRNTYLVAYSSVLDAFTIANPTFGAAVDSYLPTLSVPAGTIDWYASDPATYNLSNYTFLNGRIVKANINTRLQLSGSTANYIDITLPINYDSSEQNSCAATQQVAVTTYPTFDIATGGLFISPNTFRFYTSNNAAFPIDPNFYLRANVVYQAA